MKQILLVEDSQEIFHLVRGALDSVGRLVWAPTVETARKELSGKEFELILLDVGLPDGSGFDFCQEVTATPKGKRTPILFLTAHDEISEKLMGFSAGGDDYITKPFSPLELKARVEARLRTVSQLKVEGDSLRWKELELLKSKQQVLLYTQKGQEVADLTSIEFKLMMLFAQRPEEVVLRDEILNEVWGEDVHVYSRSVDTHVSK
ncbi:MAG: DNA-binding response regulator, partial [Bdellovibrionaceae bacterium]|nr:DNA-binding response regulator [Pseudobdellovibrionaceae bacterium]